MWGSQRYCLGWWIDLPLACSINPEPGFAQEARYTIEIGADRLQR